MNGKRNESWWDRNWKWFVPVGCMSIIGFLSAVVVLIGVILFGSIRATGAYKEAVALAMSDPDVIQSLGEPVNVGWFASGNVNITGPSGRAELSVPLVGRQAEGTLYIIANKRAGRWEFELLEVEVEGRDERIDLLSRPEAPLSRS